MENYKVCLDAGHGGKDPGAIKGSRQEKNDALRIVKAIGAVLTEQGIEVVYTRVSDIYDNVNEKAAKANKSKADVFLSIHRNAAAAANANGTENWIMTQSSKALILARALCSRYQILGFTDRGVKNCISQNKNLGVLRDTSMPAVLVELGFISNKKDNQLFDQLFQEIALYTAYAILDYLGVSYQIYQVAKNEWVQDGSRWWYRYKDNSYPTDKWEEIDGVWYLFDSSGWMRTGWAKWKGEWYYLQSNGAMIEGNVTIYKE